MFFSHILSSVYPTCVGKSRSWNIPLLISEGSDSVALSELFVNQTFLFLSAKLVQLLHVVMPECLSVYFPG